MAAGPAQQVERGTPPPRLRKHTSPSEWLKEAIFFPMGKCPQLQNKERELDSNKGARQLKPSQLQRGAAQGPPPKACAVPVPGEHLARPPPRLCSSSSSRPPPLGAHLPGPAGPPSQEAYLPPCAAQTVCSGVFFCEKRTVRGSCTSSVSPPMLPPPGGDMTTPS